MDFVTCIKERRSVRKFSDKPVTKETLLAIGELCRWAPSWKNSQTAGYEVIVNEELKNKIAEECVLGHPFNTKTIQRAAAVVVLTTEGGKSGYGDGTVTTSKGDTWGFFDAGIAAQTFCLAAYSEGVGSVILGVFDDAKVAALCKLPQGVTASCLIAIGYLLDTVAKPGPARKSVEEIMHIVE